MKNFEVKTRLFLLICIYFFITISIYSQVLIGDANGKSTILVNGGNFAFDAQKESITFDYAHFENHIFKKSKNKFVWGTSFSGKPDNGISELISGGSVAMSGRLNGFIGFSTLYNRDDIFKKGMLSKSKKNDFKSSKSLLESIADTFEKQKKLEIEKLKGIRNTNGLIRRIYLVEARDTLKFKVITYLEKPSVIKLIKDSLRIINDTAVFNLLTSDIKIDIDLSGNIDTISLVKKIIKRDVKKKYLDSLERAGDFSDFIPKLTDLTNYYRLKAGTLAKNINEETFVNGEIKLVPISDSQLKKNREEVRYYKALEEITNALYKILYETFKTLETKVEKSDGDYQKSETALKNSRNQLDSLRTYWVSKGTFYLRVGAAGNSFKSFTGIDTLNVSDGLLRKYFSGFNAELGYNFHKGGDHILGGSVGFEKMDNFGNLTEQEISISQEGKDKLGQKISVVQKLKGYKGSYQTYDQINLNLDYVKFFPIKDAKAQYNTVLNLWIRHKMPLAQYQSIAKTTTNVGVSLNFFRNDGILMGGLYAGINDIEDNQRLIVGNDPMDLSKRFVFGIIAKANFVKLIGF